MNTVQLWKEYQQTRAVEDRNKIVCHYLPLARSYAGRICNSLAKHADIEEIESAAFLGLISAVERYDPNRKVKFETFSHPRIHGSIMDWLRLQDRQSRSVRTFERKLELFRERLSQNGPVSEDDLARAMNLTNSRFGFLTEVLQRGREVYISSLESYSDEHQDHVLQVADTNAEDPSSTVATKLFMDVVLTGLPIQERIVAMHYHFGGLTLKQIGKKLGLTESRASQIKVSAHALIRARLQRRGRDSL